MCLWSSPDTTVRPQILCGLEEGGGQCGQDLDWLNQVMLGRIFVIWALELLKDLVPPSTLICKMTCVGIFVKMYTFLVVGGGCNTGSAGLIIPFQ